MTERHYNAVIIGGFGGSGSSAVVDFLREFDTFKNFGVELRLLVDPDGIMSLENALVKGWTPFISDIAIKRFKNLIGRLSNRYKYPHFGADHTRLLGNQFVKLSNEYINKLVSFSYDGLWAGINSPLYVLGYRIDRRLGKNLFGLSKPIYVAWPKNQFILLTREYMDNLISSYIDDNTVRNVVIDEGYASLHPSRVLNYFHSAKLIIAHRDPRDTFVNALKYKFDFIPHDVENFIKWYKYLHIQSEQDAGSDEQVLRIQFENLVLNYEETVDKIQAFLSTDASMHIHKRKFFNPDISIENIGLWKLYKNQADMEKIYSNLEKYCYSA